MIRGSRVALIAAIALASPIVHAEPSSEADQAFKKGRDLFRTGDFAAACVQFERSEQLDPELGTLFNIAQCDERIGKLASAIAAYREVVAKDPNGKRKAIAAEYAVKLEQRVPKIVVQVVSPPADLAVTLDGKPIEANQPVEVDFGAHAIVAHASGFRELTRSVKIDSEGRTTSVPAALESDHAVTTVVAPPPPHVVESEPAAAPAPKSQRKKYAVVAIAVGGATLVAGLVFGGLAHSNWNSATAVCGGTICPTQTLVDQANTFATTATNDGNLATGLAIGGGVVLAIGIGLWLTAPSDEHAVRVTATANGLGLAGRF